MTINRKLNTSLQSGARRSLISRPVRGESHALLSTEEAPEIDVGPDIQSHHDQQHGRGHDEQRSDETDARGSSCSPPARFLMKGAPHVAGKLRQSLSQRYSQLLRLQQRGDEGAQGFRFIPSPQRLEGLPPARPQVHLPEGRLDLICKWSSECIRDARHGRPKADSGAHSDCEDVEEVGKVPVDLSLPPACLAGDPDVRPQPPEDHKPGEHKPQAVEQEEDPGESKQNDVGGLTSGVALDRGWFTRCIEFPPYGSYLALPHHARGPRSEVVAEPVDQAEDQTAFGRVGLIGGGVLSETADGTSVARHRPALDRQQVATSQSDCGGQWIHRATPRSSLCVGSERIRGNTRIRQSPAPLVQLAATPSFR